MYLYVLVVCGLKTSSCVCDGLVSRCCPVGELWWTGCSLKRLIIAHHGIIFWLQGQTLGHTHTHTAHVTLVQCGGFFAHRCSESVPDPWIPSGFRLFERSVEDECSETGLSGWWQLLFLDRPHFYLYSLHPREQMTPAHVSASSICVYNSPLELFK